MGGVTIVAWVVCLSCRWLVAAVVVVLGACMLQPVHVLVEQAGCDWDHKVAGAPSQV